jgi:hypothetical protein
MHKFVTWSAIALSSTALSALPLLPAVAASPQDMPIPFTEPAPPQIDATAQQWIDRLWQTTANLSDPGKQSETWLQIAALYSATYQDSQKSAEALNNGFVAAQSIDDPAAKADALLQVLSFQRSDPAAAKTVELILEAIAAVPDRNRQQGLLEFAVIALTDLEPAVRLKPELQPLALIDRIQDPQIREIRRAYAVDARVWQLIKQKQLTAAIELIQQTPTLPFFPVEPDPSEFTNPSRDRLLQAKVERLDALTNGVFLYSDTANPTEAELDAIAAQLQPVAQGWINDIQDPYIKARAQSSWIAYLMRFGQSATATAQAQAFLQSLTNLAIAPAQKVELLLPFIQYSWENAPASQPLLQLLIQTLQAQLNAMGNTAAVQPQKAQLLMAVSYSVPYGSLPLLDVVTAEVNKITDAKLRSGLLYAFSVQYELGNHDAQAKAMYQQILPLIDQMEDQSHAIAVLIKLGRMEEAIEYAKKNQEDYVLYDLSSQLVNQQSIPAALDLSRRIQDPWLRILSLGQITASLSATNDPNALEPLREAIEYLQTLPADTQGNAFYALGAQLNTPGSLQLLDSLPPLLQLGALLSYVDNYGGVMSAQNSQMSQRLVKILPSLTQTEQKDQALSALAFLDAVERPDRVSQWIDQMTPTAQAATLLRAIYLRSYLSTPFQP